MTRKCRNKTQTEAGGAGVVGGENLTASLASLAPSVAEVWVWWPEGNGGETQSAPAHSLLLSSSPLFKF